VYNVSGGFLSSQLLPYVNVLEGLAIANNGDVLACDFSGRAYWRLNPDFTSPVRLPAPSSGVWRPYGVVVNKADGIVVVADWGGQRLVIYNPATTIIKQVPSLDVRPSKVAVSDNGDMYVISVPDDKMIVVFNSTGTKLRQYVTPPISVRSSLLNGVSVTADGVMWLADEYYTLWRVRPCFV
jgi:streptogramin lyase